MNTMTNTAEFSHHAAQADHSEFFPTLWRTLVGLLCMSAAIDSVDQELLAHHIVLE